MQKPHYHGHRKRLRERFRQTGLKGFRDYEAVELMLSYVLPRKDVKPVAKDLIAKFGGYRGVLDAPFEELVTVKGVGEVAATFLKALKESASLYLKMGLRGGRDVLSSTGALLDYLGTEMSGLKDEQFRAVFLDSQNGVVADEVIQEGTVNQSVVYPRKVMERALHYKAAALILVHNHPGGGCKPSDDDRVLTAELVKIAKGLQITVHDHIIICRSGYFSFRERGLLRTG